MADIADELRATLGTAYTVERELFGGGMSRVFVARDNALDRDVVVKVLPRELSASVSIERFNREIMLAAALQHAHIVPVLSAGETDGLPFFIMPYVDGESLRQRLSRGPLSIRESVSIMKDVARALSYAHNKGVIHRDIKPDNIMFSAGSATVTDFGVAKAISAARGPVRTSGPRAPASTITSVGTSLGTPAYMAPEQVAADPNTDHRADLYSLGIVAYEMLVGAPPFQGRTPQALLAAQLTEPPAPLATRRYDVPQALAAIIMKCLEKDAAHRPRSADEVVRALDDPSVMGGPAASTPAVVATRRNRRLRDAIRTAIIVGVIVGLVVLVRYCTARLITPGDSALISATDGRAD